jgi:hypothetical protein
LNKWVRYEQGMTRGQARWVRSRGLRVAFGTDAQEVDNRFTTSQRTNDHQGVKQRVSIRKTHSDEVGASDLRQANGCATDGR